MSGAASPTASAAAAAVAVSPVTQALGYLVSVGSSVVRVGVVVVCVFVCCEPINEWMGGTCAQVKLPQLYSIVSARSVRGISLSMFVLETLTTTVSATYSYKKGAVLHLSTAQHNTTQPQKVLILCCMALLCAVGLSFAAYGENVGIGLCDLCVLYMFYKYSKE
jgi:hypothetical protein